MVFCCRLTALSFRIILRHMHSETSKTRNPHMARHDPRHTVAIRHVLAGMAKRDWTAMDLARELGADSGLVSRWLRGKQRPSAEYICEFERLFGTTCRDWVTADADRAPLPTIPRFRASKASRNGRARRSRRTKSRSVKRS